MHLLDMGMQAIYLNKSLARQTRPLQVPTTRNTPLMLWPWKGKSNLACSLKSLLSSQCRAYTSFSTSSRLRLSTAFVRFSEQSLKWRRAGGGRFWWRR